MLVALALCSIVLGGITACDRNPFEPLPAPKLGPPPRSFDLLIDTVGQFNSDLSGDWFASGVSAWDGGVPYNYPGLKPFVFPYPTIITVEISGNVTKTTGAITVTGPQKPWKPSGVVTPNTNYSGTIGYVNLSPQGGGALFLRADTTDIVTDTIKVVNQVWPFRGAIDGAQPDNGPNRENCGMSNNKTPPLACYNYVGTARFKWNRPHVALTLSRNPAGVVPVNSAVVFTAGKALATIGSNTVDLSALAWHWFADSDTIDTGTCVAGSLTCTRTINKPGTLISTAYVNGEDQLKALHVDTAGTPPPPAPVRCDSVSDTKVFPELTNSDTAFKTLWDESNYRPNIPDLLRRERGGFIIQDSISHAYSFQRFDFPSFPCSMQPDFTRPLPRGAVAWVHVHEWAIGDKMIGCGPAVVINGVPQRFSDGSIMYQTYHGWPSFDNDGDLAVSEKWGNLPGYILDADGITRFQFNPNSSLPYNDHGQRLSRCGYGT